MDGEAARRVLITGVGGPLGARLAARLEAAEQVEYLAGVDLTEPAVPLARTEFVRADLRNPLVTQIIDTARIDTVVHLAVTATPQSAGGRSRMKEHNVIGTMQLLGAAQNAPAVRRLVLKSTTAIYGSSYAAPSLLREDAEIEAHPLRGYTKDAVEVEGYARAFGRRRPDAALTLLRFANFLGPTVSSPLTRYFALPVVPTVLGFDPRLQFCHEDDAVEVLYRSVIDDHPGIFNVAGHGVVYLSQAIRLVGKPAVPVPLPLVNVAGALARRAGRIDFSPEQLQFLLYGRVVDISRLQQVLGYEMAYSTRRTLEDFVASGRVEPVITPERAARVEGAVRRRLAGAGRQGAAT